MDDASRREGSGLEYLRRVFSDDHAGRLGLAVVIVGVMEASAMRWFFTP
jgi:hypothetical protein